MRLWTEFRRSEKAEELWQSAQVQSVEQTPLEEKHGQYNLRHMDCLQLQPLSSFLESKLIGREDRGKPKRALVSEGGWLGDRGWETWGSGSLG